MVLCVNSLAQRLRLATNSAYIYGIKREDDVILFSSLTSTVLEHTLPFPFCRVGLFLYISDPLEDVKSSVLSAIADEKTAPYLVVCRVGNSLISFRYKSGVLTEEELSFTNVQDINLIPLKVTAPLDLVVSNSTFKLKQALQSYRDKLNSAASSFLLEGSNYLWIGGEKAWLIGMPSDSTVEDVLSLKPPEKSNVNDSQLSFTLLWSSVYSDIPKTCAPVLYLGKKSSDTVHLPIRLVALAYIERKAPADKISEALIQALLKQLVSVETLLSSQWTRKQSLQVPEILHVEPKELQHYVSLMVDSNQTDDDLRKTREELHRAFFLSLDRPYFRRWNCLDRLTNISSYLTSPHKAVPDPVGYDPEHIAVVKGDYVYHHYLQDGVRDSGWGCAYRSLQTLVSWFRLQGYTDQRTPSHATIQKCLVDIGDKPASFQGSQKWLGSLEVSFVLQSYLGINSHIMTVQRGAELPRHARQLAHHFQEVGTPVMIGGGVLAHTILGIAWSESTEDIELLVLDPHFEGEEHLTTVVRKGWCGWKKMSFWSKDSFYNLCLPERPATY